MVPVAAEKIFSLGSLPVTNSLFTGWIVVAILVALSVAISRRVKEVPTGLQNAAEAILEGMLNFMDQVTQDRARSRRFLPIIGALFPFILLSNWFGLLPGVGTIGFHHGEHLVPLFRPATSDLNATLAMSITVVIVSHIIGVMTIGFFRYWNKFIQIGSLWKAVSKIGKVSFGDYAIGIFTALINMVVGLIELMSEAAKMVSLALRLFGNVFAGEVLIHVLSSLIAFLLPTPFMFLEIIVGVVQATVFSMLTLVYLTLATDPPHDEHDEDHANEHAGAHGDVHESKAAAH